MSKIEDTPNHVTAAPTRTKQVGASVVSGLAAVLLIVSLSGPGWLYVPANPATGAPATTLSFQDLNHLTEVIPSTAWQQAYFSWAGWVLAILVILAAAFVLLRPSVASATALLVAAAVGLVATVFGVKGPLWWSQFIDAADQIRIGGYLLDLAYVALLAVGVIRLVALRRSH